MYYAGGPARQLSIYLMNDKEDWMGEYLTRAFPRDPFTSISQIFCGRKKHPASWRDQTNPEASLESPRERLQLA